MSHIWYYVFCPPRYACGGPRVGAACIVVVVRCPRASCAALCCTVDKHAKAVCGWSRIVLSADAALSARSVKLCTIFVKICEVM